MTPHKWGNSLPWWAYPWLDEVKKVWIIFMDINLGSGKSLHSSSSKTSIP